MAQIIPLVILALLLVAMVSFSRRNKLRTAAQNDARRAKMSPGLEVMTTSGLYGTVVTVNDDDTVLLSIAPGVEVRWTVAALREVDELPEAYRAPLESPAPRADTGDANPIQG